MPCTKHCSICGKAFKGEFQDVMAKLRRHRKQKHPKAHRESVKKALKTKGILDPSKEKTKKCEQCGGKLVFSGQFIDGKPVWKHVSPKKEKQCLRIWAREQQARATERMFKAIDKGILDPLKARKGLTNKPHVLGYSDYKCSGLVRVLRRVGDNFPEFALYPSRKTIIVPSLQQAGFNEESRGKWVLRTNKFNIFVYI